MGRNRLTPLALAIPMAAVLLSHSLYAQDGPANSDTANLSGGIVRGWTEADARMFEITGGVALRHGPHSLTARRAVVWYYPTLSQLRRQVVLDIYAEGDVTVAGPERTMTVDNGLFRWQQGRALNVTGDDSRVETLDAAPFTDFLFRARRRRRDEPPLPPWEQGASEAITVSAQEIRSFSEDVRDVFIAQGDVRLTRGDHVVEARRAVVWLDKRKSQTLGATVIDVFVEGDVRIVTPGATLRQQAEFFSWMSASPRGIAFTDRDGIVPYYDEPQFKPFYRMAQRARILRSQTPAAERRHVIRHVGAADPELKFVYIPGQKIETQAIDGQRVTTLTGGVHFLFGAIDIRCDSMVVWGETDEPFSKPVQIYAEGADLTLTFPDTTLHDLLSERDALMTPTGDVGYRTVKADRLLIDLRTQEFIVVQGTLQTIHKTRQVPVYYHADRIRRELVPPDDTEGAHDVTVWISPDNPNIAYNAPGLDPASRAPLQEKTVTSDRLRGWRRLADLPQDPARPRSPILELRQTELNPPRQRLIMDNAYITTSEFGVPHYRFASRQVILEDLTPQERDDALDERRARRATTRDNWFLFGPVPVFYWPRFQHDLDSELTGLRSLRLRTSSDKGFQAYTTWDLQSFGLFDNYWSEWLLNIDPMSRRGVGLGVNSRWSRNDHAGWLRSYYIRDQADFDGPGDAFAVTTRNRGRVRLQNRWQLTDATRIDLEYNHLSDRNFLYQYFENEFKNQKKTENIFYLHHLDGIFGATALGSFSVASFVETVEYMPQVRGYLLGKSLWDDRLVYKGDTQVANVRGRPDDLFPLLGIDEGRTWRFHSDHEVAWPLTFGPYQFAPFAGAGVAVYEQGVAGNSLGRLIGSLGFRSSTQFWQTFPLESRLWDLRDLRHIITPTLDYTNVYGATHSAADFYRLDAVDQIDEFQAFDIGIRQRLQTKRRAKYVGDDIEHMATGGLTVVDWMVFDLRTSFYPNARRDNADDDFGAMQFDYQWRLSERLTFSTDGFFDMYDGSFNTANVGIHLNHSPRLRTYIGNRHIRALDSSLFVFNADYTIDPRWSIDTLVLYDHGQSRLSVARTSVVRRLHRWMLDVGVEFNNNKDDVIFSITLSPQGIPETRVQFF